MGCRGTLHNSSGSTLLEQALILPVIFGFIVIAVDVAHVTRSYDALRQGVKTALRCVYPASAACNQISAAAPPALYDVTRFNLETTAYTNTENYSGTGFHIQKPMYSFSNFQATVLGDVHYRETLWNHRAEQRYFPAEGSLSGNVLQAQGPYITGSTPGNASFRFFGQHGASYPQANFTANTNSNLIASNNRWVDSSNSVRNLGYISLTLNAPAGLDPSAPCYESTNYDTQTGPHDPNMNAECPNWARHGTYVALWLRGHSQGSIDGGEAVIEVSLRPAMQQSNYNQNFESLTPDAPYLRNLGGRHFRSTSGMRDASLVPRGAIGNAYIDPSYDFDELQQHKRIFMLYGEKYRLHLSLRYMGGAPGRVYYNPGTIQMYAAMFEDYSLGNVSCEGGILPHQEGDSSACQNSSNAHVSNPTITDWQSPLRSGAVVDLGNHPESLIDYQNELRARSIPYPQDYFPLPTTEQRISRSSSCPAIGEAGNFGVAEETQSGFIYNSAEADKICPPPAGDNINGVRWSETTQPVPGDPVGTWVRNDCAHAHDILEILPELAPYRKLSAGYLHYSGPSTEKIYTGRGSAATHHPINVIANEYACNDYPGGFTVGTEFFNDESFSQRSETTLFSGYHHPLGCNYKQQLQDEAISLGLDQDSYFEVADPVAGASIVLEGEPDSCTSHFHGSSTSTNPLPLGQFQEDQIPAICSQAGYTCRLEFAGFAGELPKNNGVTHQLEKAARDYGFPQLQLANPKARWSCSGKDCAHIELNADSTQVTGTGTATVGLLNAFGAPFELNMSYSESEALEVNL